MIVSQNQQILKLLRHQPVTALDALKVAGCLRLAARIAELRADGHNIKTVTVTTTSGKRIASYHLKGKRNGR